MKYRFDDIQNGTLEHGQTVVIILNSEAEIANDDAEAAALAEKNGGVLVETEKPARERRAKSGGITNGS